MAMAVLGMNRRIREPFSGEPMDVAEFLADGVGSQTRLFRAASLTGRICAGHAHDTRMVPRTPAPLCTPSRCVSRL